MRILIPGPCFDDSFVENVKVTLLAMGHEVIGAEPVAFARHWSPASHALRILRERLRGNRPSGDDLRLLKLARAARPDMVLGLTWDMHVEVLHDLGRICRGRRVLWWGDAPANSKRWGILNPGWDRVYVKDPDAVRKLRLAGQNAELLHEAMNPKWHRPVAKQANGDLVVAGNYYAFRQAIIARLMRDGVTFQLYGSKPPVWALPEIRAHYSSKYVTYEEKARVFGAGLACLNTFHPSEGNSLNCRAFEVAGSGGLQLIEHRPMIAECFEPGKELLVFHTYEELVDFIKRARAYPAEMSSIREAGARRALAEHTYQHRLSRILADLG